MSSNPISRVDAISFGALAAERDIQAGLAEYFVESESFERLLKGQKIVALGNRGAGKTAIFKMIAERLTKSGARVVELAPEDYSYELLSQTMTAEQRGAWAKQGAYAAAWKFLLYVLAMKAANRAGGLKTGPAKRIYDYLRDNYRDGGTNPVAILISYLKRLEGVKLGKLEASVKAKSLHQLYRLEELEPLLDDLNSLAESKQIVMLVDELDRGWDASEDAVAFVAGLFQAALAINLRTPNIRVLISLRRELYENIPALYEDAQKVRDVIEVIEWDEPSLLTLVAKRIARSSPKYASLTDTEAWESFCAGTLEFRKSNSFNYVIDRTLYRPRELIQFCHAIQDVAIKKAESLPVNYSVIVEAEHGYSDDRVKDIAAEYRFQYPGLLSVFETFRGKGYAMERDELELHCLAIATGEFQVEQQASWRDLDPDVLIDRLWRVGFLRAQAVGGIRARRRSGSSYLGPHQVSSLNLRNIQRFHIHPMFRAGLGMRETKRAGSDSSEVD
jgi:hypothetical protein